MPARTRKDLEQSLKKGQIEPVYFLYGAETYLRDGAAQQIVEAALTGTLLREFNDSSFDLLTDDIRDAIAAAEQLPLMSDRRVIVVKHLSKLEGRKKFDEEEEDDVSLAAQILMDYLSRPVATSVVIFTSDDIDKRRKYAKLLLASAAYEFKPLQQKDLPAWIRDYLRTLDTQIDQAALSVLTDTLASDLVTVKNELNKLATAALPRPARSPVLAHDGARCGRNVAVPEGRGPRETRALAGIEKPKKHGGPVRAPAIHSFHQSPRGAPPGPRIDLLGRCGPVLRRFRNRRARPSKIRCARLVTPPCVEAPPGSGGPSPSRL